MLISNEQLEKAAHIGTIVQSVAVVFALGIAWNEFVLNDKDQREQEYEAVSDIISKQVHPEFVSRAFYNLYANREATLGQEPMEFEDSIGELHSYFWLIDSCIGMEICNSQEALKRFCGDFDSYRDIIRTRYNYSDDELRRELEEQRGLSTLNTHCPASNGGAQGAATQPINPD